MKYYFDHDKKKDMGYENLQKVKHSSVKTVSELEKELVNVKNHFQ